jgi:hypothetical protein
MARALLLDTALPTGTRRVARGLAVDGQPAQHARPPGTVVVSGARAIGHVRAVITITPNSPRAAVNRASPDVGEERGVGFVQPTASGDTLSRFAVLDLSQDD